MYIHVIFTYPRSGFLYQRLVMKAPDDIDWMRFNELFEERVQSTMFHVYYYLLPWPQL